MMEQKRYYWLKFQHDFFTSKRIKKLRSLAGGDTFTIIYLKMQLKSLETNGVLEYIGIEPSFAEEIAIDIDEKPENVGVTVNYLLSCGLMEKLDKNHMILPYVEENTGSETASAQRGREYRAKLTDEQRRVERERVRIAVSEYRQRMTDCNEQCNERVTNVEKEIEKDIDIEIEKNEVVINNHSSETKAVSDLAAEWNKLSDIGIKPICKLSSGSKRYASAQARIKQYGYETVVKAIHNIRDSDFLIGKNKNGWVITFDWFVLPNNFPKVLEGNYSKTEQGKDDAFERWLNK